MRNGECDNDRNYFTRRAREERDRALTCEDNAVALVHFSLADMYESKLTDNVVRLPLAG